MRALKTMSCPRVWRSSLFALALTLGASGAAHATPFLTGDVLTFDAGEWGGGTASPAPDILAVNYFTVYPFGLLEVGIPGLAGFSMAFTSASHIIAYLPGTGTPGPLQGDLLNPLITASGSFGGEVTALQLNVDFSDAGFVLGALGIPFGDLILANFSTLPLLNGLTVDAYSDIVNTLLGGGSAIYTIADLAPITEQLNQSFLLGVPSTFAEEHLVLPDGPTTPVPEPSTMVLVGLGLGALELVRRRKRA